MIHLQGVTLAINTHSRHQLLGVGQVGVRMPAIEVLGMKEREGEIQAWDDSCGAVPKVHGGGHGRWEWCRYQPLGGIERERVDIPPC